MIRRAAAVLLALAAAAPLGALAGERMQPGLWEVTATVEVQGMDAPMPPATQTECLSQADLDEDPASTVDKGLCRATDVRRSGDTVSFELDCGGATPGRGQGQIVYRSPTSYDGWLKMDLGGARLRTTQRARRLGPCPDAR